MKYFINIDKSRDNDQYGWIYLGLSQTETEVTVYEEITGVGSDLKYMNLKGYQLPIEDLKEITKEQYDMLKYNIFNNGDMDEVNSLVEKVISCK